jgi:two-component system response regulator AtoC
MEPRILVVDDDPDYLDILKRKIASADIGPVTGEVDPVRAANRLAAGESFDLALIDMSMPEIDGLQLLGMLRQVNPATECIIVTAVNDARTAVACLNSGAYDYLVKPVATEDLLLAVNRALEHKRLRDLIHIRGNSRLTRLKNKAPFEPIVTRSAAMIKILQEAELHAGSNVPVLITGESGTGKELLARAIHDASRRAGKAFTAVNMASVSDSLFEAEFFGHEKGAFTGAERGRDGYLKRAHGGTLFLDEIGNLPGALQGKLLRFLQEGEYYKLGASAHRRADVRVIAATNEDLEKLMTRGRFRKDLYYRILGGWLHLPPLRDRLEDIPLLTRLFLRRFGQGGALPPVDQKAMCLLMDYRYPGNVRELIAVLRSALNLSRGQAIRPAHLPESVRKPSALGRCNAAAAAAAPLASLARVEKNHILHVYETTARNKSKTARTLGIGLNTLRRKLRLYGLD